MSSRPVDEAVSREILWIFMRHRIAVNGILQRNNFFNVRDGDFQRGINKAAAKNWIAIDLRNRYRYRVTAMGYAAARMFDAALDARPLRHSGHHHSPPANLNVRGFRAIDYQSVNAA
jgi:hypothetical protein